MLPVYFFQSRLVSDYRRTGCHRSEFYAGFFHHTIEKSLLQLTVLLQIRSECLNLLCIVRPHILLVHIQFEVVVRPFTALILPDGIGYDQCPQGRLFFDPPTNPSHRHAGRRERRNCRCRNNRTINQPHPGKLDAYPPHTPDGNVLAIQTIEDSQIANLCIRMAECIPFFRKRCDYYERKRNLFIRTLQYSLHSGFPNTAPAYIFNRRHPRRDKTISVELEYLRITT